MPNDTTQPTILVKKSDGTSVRMTMDELQAYKKAQTASVPAPANIPVAPKSPVQQIKKPEPQKKPTPAPVKQSPSPQSPVHKTYTRPAPPKEEKMFEENWGTDDHKSLLDESPAKGSLPMVKAMTAPLPTTTTPVKNIFVDEAKYKSMKHEARSMKPEMPKIIPKQSPKTYNLQPNTYTEKPLVQDIKHPQIVKQSVGPVDEMNNFSLIDFRRLDLNPKAAGQKLLDKFQTLKEDSFLLFMEGVKAWYNSPIYKQYQDVLLQSLMHSKSVNEILVSGNPQKDLKPDEFKVILSVNEAIS